MTEGHSSQGTQAAVSDAEDTSDWLTWSGGTVLPDEMIEHLRETIGALDALLASTYLSRDFELPGPDDPAPSIPRPETDPQPSPARPAQAENPQAENAQAGDEPEPVRQAAKPAGKSKKG